MAEESKWCPGCDRSSEDHPELRDDRGWRSVSGYGYEVCKDCWAGLRPFKRILLTMLAAPAHDPGLTLGVAGDMDYFFGFAKKAFRAWHGHGPESVCSECDPEEYRRLAEWRREREQKRREATS